MAQKFDPSDPRYHDRFAASVELLKMWRNLIREGGVPRYTVLPGAALNTLVEWTDDFLHYPQTDALKFEDVPKT